MGALIKLMDSVLFLFFMFIAVVAPIFDTEVCFPVKYQPSFLTNIKLWYVRDYGDYLVVEKPSFFVGLVWLRLCFQWPLTILNLYGIIVGGRPWFNTTCLIYGVSYCTAMVAAIGELMGSQRASDKLLMTFFLFMGLGVLAIVRGLVPNSSKTTTIERKPKRT